MLFQLFSFHKWHGTLHKALFLFFNFFTSLLTRGALILDQLQQKEPKQLNLFWLFDFLHLLFFDVYLFFSTNGISVFFSSVFFSEFFGSSTGSPIPYAARTFFSISALNSGCSRKYFLAFSRP